MGRATPHCCRGSWPGSRPGMTSPSPLATPTAAATRGSRRAGTCGGAGRAPAQQQEVLAAPSIEAHPPRLGRHPRRPTEKAFRLSRIADVDTLIPGAPAFVTHRDGPAGDAPEHVEELTKRQGVAGPS